MAFTEVLKLIQDGELVKAAIANRAPSTNDSNIRYLRDLFEAAMLGETIFARNRVVETDAKVGMAVYFNPTTDQFERGRGAVEVDSTTGNLVTTKSSQIWGIIHTKHNANLADLLLHGVAEVDLSEAVDGTVEEGSVYYLSNVSPGKLETQRPPVGVTVMQVGDLAASGDHEVYVNTKFHDFLEAHRHFKFTLTSLPAGDHTPPSPGERHTITNADSGQEGWLPANHTVFGGKAPAGAAFGYNLSVSALNDLWPPLPASGAYLEWDKGDDKAQMGMGVPLGTDKLCYINDDGIWWMSDCYDDVPWPTSWDGQVSVSESESFIECPRNLYMTMTLYFTKPVFQNTGNWVESLTAKEGSGLVITCPDNNEVASVGHLLIDLDLSLSQGVDTKTGHIVMKELTSDGKLDRGPVVESIKASGANVTITSDVTTSGPNNGKHGNLTIAVDQDLDGNEVSIDTVRLDGVEEEFFEDVIGLGFPQGRRAEFRGRIMIPDGLVLPSGTQLKLRFWFLNRSTTNIPSGLFNLTYRRLTQPATADVSVVDLPTSETGTLTAIPGSTINVASTINRYFMTESEAFDIAVGDIVLFTLERQGDTDGLLADLHLLRQRGVYVEP